MFVNKIPYLQTHEDNNYVAKEYRCSLHLGQQGTLNVDTIFTV